MGDQKKNEEKNSASGLEDSATSAIRKAKKYLLNQEMLARIEKKQRLERQRARRYLVNSEVLEANGNPGKGSKITDLSMNGAKILVPFSPPFMSQMVLKFGLEESEKIFRVVGRVPLVQNDPAEGLVRSGGAILSELLGDRAHPETAGALKPAIPQVAGETPREAADPRLRWTSRMAIAAGVTPEMRAAWPRESGRISLSFWRTSLERPATAS